MSAEEGGVETGHASVTLQEISDQGVLVSDNTFAVSSAGGNIATWTFPVPLLMDGYFGLEDPRLTARANSPDTIHAYVAVDQAVYADILNFVTAPPYGGPAGAQMPWSTAGLPSHEVNYSVTGVAGYSCISFANAVYSMIPGMAGSNALTLFTTEQLTQLPANEIGRWYGGYAYLRAIGATARRAE